MKQPTHAGGLVYRCTQGVLRYALVTASDDPETWVLPKGHIEQYENAQQAAVREVLEETGIEARVVSDLGVLRFSRKSQDIRAQFFLMVHEATTPTTEKRKLTWATFDEALELLTHEDARDLLVDAQPFVVAALAAATSSEAAQALLLKDYDSLTQALAANETLGDTRLNFFVGLVTAVVAGLVTLSSSDSTNAQVMSEPVTLFAVLALLALGIVVLFRIIHRNSVTDGYRKDLDRIRAIYREHFDRSGVLHSFRPFSKWDKDKTGKKPVYKGRSFGGLADTVAVINGLLLAGLLTLPPVSWEARRVAIASVLFVVVQVAYVRIRDSMSKNK